MLPDLIKHALVYTLCDIGQLSPSDKRLLNRYVKRGWLSKGKGGPFPKLKTVYARPDFDFMTERNRLVDEMMALAELDAQNTALRKSTLTTPKNAPEGDSVAVGGI